MTKTNIFALIFTIVTLIIIAICTLYRPSIWSVSVGVVVFTLTMGYLNRSDLRKLLDHISTVLHLNTNNLANERIITILLCLLIIVLILIGGSILILLY